ncbi:MAG: prefoldin subunit beta [Candidatus Aenigmarchaeota archaeon]
MDKETEHLLSQAQMYQQQIQTILTQKNALALELNEIKKALEEVNKTERESVFKVSGPILIKTDIKDIKEELGEKENTIDLRMKTIEKQELRLKEKIEELRSKLTKSQPKAG